LPVSVIANRLGFDEPTNFVKFFRREVQKSPGEFRGEYTFRLEGDALSGITG
jgi:AraC-like DNA-binding protein